MSVMLERKVNELEGKSFYDRSLPNALEQAQAYAKDGGFVASMPQLLHGRVVAPSDNEIWTDWCTANSEEVVGRTAQGNTVAIEVTGGGVLSLPARIQKAYSDGLTKEYSAKFTDKEVKDLLAGKLPDGTELPVFSFDEFKKGIADLPMQYAVVMDFYSLSKLESGYQKIDNLKDNPLVIARAGGVEQAEQFLAKAKKVYGKRLGNWHPFKAVNPDQPQGRVLFLGGNNGDGLYGDDSINSSGRLVGVAPEALVARENSAPQVSEKPLENRIQTALEKKEQFEHDGTLYIPVGDKKLQLKLGEILGLKQT